MGECFNRTSSATFSILDNLKSSTHYPRAMEVYSNSLRQEFVFSHLEMATDASDVRRKVLECQISRFLTHE
jgi:hypothetical protein